jgi:hypothetical protein
MRKLAHGFIFFFLKHLKTIHDRTHRTDDIVTHAATEQCRKFEWFERNNGHK